MKILRILPVFLFLLWACHRQASGTAGVRWLPRPVVPVHLQDGPTTLNPGDWVSGPLSAGSFEASPRFTLRYDSVRRLVTLMPGTGFRPVENLRIRSGDTLWDIPLFRSGKIPVVFGLPHHDSIRQVAFKSRITGWVPRPMTREANRWTFHTALEPGNYPYLFVVNGKEITDPANPRKEPNGLGGYNSVLQIPLHRSERPLMIPLRVIPGGFVIRVNDPHSSFLFYRDHRLIHPRIRIRGNKVLVDLHLPDDGRLHYLSVFAYNRYGRGNDLLIPMKGNRILTDVSGLPVSDFHTQIIYNVMIDRFVNGNPHNDRPVRDDSVLHKVNFWGGDLAGITRKIREGYFRRLGVNTLWISPPVRNPDDAWGHWPHPPTKFTGYHGYWPVAIRQIDPRFGTPDDFRTLIATAHRRHMRVLMDYVANHVHIRHPLYRLRPGWFTSLRLPDGSLNLQKWDEHRLTTWFDTFMPSFDFSRHQVVEAMTDTALFWPAHFDIDGFRHDATKHIALDYWRTLTRKLRSRVHRPLFQIGETYGSPELIRSYIGNGLLDAQFDFNLYDAALQNFARPQGDAPSLARALRQSLFQYGSHHLMGNISGNQDRVRFISYASGDVRFDEDGKQAGWDRRIGVSDSLAYRRLALLHAFNMSIPGIPVIYYGDEIGMPGANDPDNRRMMYFSGRWSGPEKQLFRRVSRLARLRSRSMALIYGTTVVQAPDRNRLIIDRYYFGEHIRTTLDLKNLSYRIESLSDTLSQTLLP